MLFLDVAWIEMIEGIEDAKSGSDLKSMFVADVQGERARHL